MKKVSVPINTYVSEIEVPEGQVYYEDLVRRSSENIFAKVMEDYPIIQEYFRLDTEYRKEDKEKSTSSLGNKGIYLRCVKNENVGIKMSIPLIYSDTSTITDSTTEYGGGFLGGSTQSTYLVDYKSNTENITPYVGSYLNRARHWIKYVDGKKIYCFKFYGGIFEYEYNNDMFLMHASPILDSNFVKVLFAKTTDGEDLMLFCGLSSMVSCNNNPLYAYLFNGESPQLCRHYNQYGYGFKDDLVRISNVFLCTSYDNDTNNRIISQFSNKFATIINDNFNIYNGASLTTRIDIVANGRLYHQILGSLFIDITDDEEENNES